MVSGPVAEAVGDVIGLGETAVTVWNIAKWPVMVVLVAFMLAVLYYWAPERQASRFRWITPGSLFAVVVWIVASALFALYVANFGSYSATYGSLGGVIVFLLWLWIANNAMLLGQEMNAELDGRGPRRPRPPRPPRAGRSGREAEHPPRLNSAIVLRRPAAGAGRSGREAEHPAAEYTPPPCSRRS